MMQTSKYINKKHLFQNGIFFVVVLFILCMVSCNNIKKDVTIDDYYLSNSIFKTDTIYQRVLIDGELFDIRVLSDKLDCNLEEFENTDDYFDNIVPKTIVITNNATGKIVFHNRIKEDVSEISFFKINENLSMPGKLYMNCYFTAGGSGSTSYLSLVHLKNNKINTTSLFQHSELDYLLFNRNDNEIYFLEGIWTMELDNTGMPIETHFDNHKYMVKQYQFNANDLQLKELGTTKGKYSSLNEGSSSFDIFRNILTYEKFMPNNIDLNNYKININYN